MSRLMIVSLIVFATCIPMAVGAVGKSTIDPNAAGVDAISGVRASQCVTYEAKRKTVASILSDLSAMTGVTLRAGYNNEDWQVRDRRMNIFAKDLPLSSLMNSIARVMKFQWSKSEYEGVVRYRLYMDRNVLLGAERQRFIEEEKLRKRRAEAREEFLTGLEDAVGMSDSELEDLKTSSPYVYTIAKNGYGDLLPRLCTEVPLARQAWLSGEVMAFDTGTLPAVVQQGLARMWEKSLSSPFGPRFAKSLANKMGQGSIVINGGQISRGYHGEATAIGDVTISMPGIVSQAFFDDPQSASAKLEGGAYVRIQDASSREEIRAIADSSSKEVAQAKAAEAKDLGEPVTEHADDPALAVKVKVKAEGREFAEALQALAKSSDFAVVSDSFDKTFWELSLPETETSVRTLLDKVESSCRYNWERHGSVLEFHDRDWFRKRAAQIPEARLEAWRKSVEKSGSLDMGELAEIAMLTTEQFWGNVLSDETLGPLGLAYRIGTNQGILRFYAGLDKQQRGLIFSEQGLSLDPESIAVQTLLQRCPTLGNSPNGSLRLMGKRVMVDKSTHYDLRVITPSGEDSGVRCAIECPTYVQPAEKKPNDAAGTRVTK